MRGTMPPALRSTLINQHHGEFQMSSIIYLVGLVVVILFILSFLGLR